MISSVIVWTIILGLLRLHSVLSLSTVNIIDGDVVASPWMRVDEVKATKSNDASPVHKRERTKTVATAPWWSGTNHSLQQATFIPPLWGLRGVPQPEIPEPTVGDNHVWFFVYDIGGPLTKVLSASVNKDLPLLPHVGIRIRGTEWFFSDHVESRKSGSHGKDANQEYLPSMSIWPGTNWAINWGDCWVVKRISSLDSIRKRMFNGPNPWREW